MVPETYRLFLIGYGLAIRQCRAELMTTQSWLQDEVAELRKELAAARAELHRLRVAEASSHPSATKAWRDRRRGDRLDLQRAVRLVQHAHPVV